MYSSHRQAASQGSQVLPALHTAALASMHATCCQQHSTLATMLARILRGELA